MYSKSNSSTKEDKRGKLFRMYTVLRRQKRSRQVHNHYGKVAMECAKRGGIGKYVSSLAEM